MVREEVGVAGGTTVEEQALHIRAIGAAEISIGQNRIKPESAVLFALALYLGLNAGEMIPRDRLLELLWPDRHGRRRHHALRQLLYRLRRLGLPIDGDDERIHLAPVEVDADITRVLAPAWHEEADRDAILAAASVLPGYAPSLSELYRTWIDELRSRADAQFRRAVVRQIALARYDGRWPEVDEWSRRCLARDPLNEEATMALAEATAMAGGKLEALRLLDGYAVELGEKAQVIGLPAKLLRRRISEPSVERLASRGGESLLVGREQEMQVLSAALERTIGGRGGSVLLRGAAGVGKSRLARELLDRSTVRGARALSVKLEASDHLRPLAVISDLVPKLLALPGAIGCDPKALNELRRLTENSPSLTSQSAPADEPEAVQHRLRSSFLELLEAVLLETALVICVDDCHYADEASVRTLVQAVRWSDERRLLWLLTARRFDATVDSPGADLAELTPALSLRPFSPDETRRLMSLLVHGLRDDELGRVSSAVHEIADGNPLFVRELARQWSETRLLDRLPRSLADAMDERIRRLSPQAALALQACVLMGNHATVARVGRALDCPARELLQSVAELDALGVLGESPSGLGLHLHELWQEEVGRSIRPATRQMLHQRIGQILELDGRTLTQPVLGWEAARHFGAAGEPEQARLLLEGWAAHLLAIGFPLDAADTLDRALSFCRTDGSRLHCLKSRISALAQAAQWEALTQIVGPTLALEEKVDPAHDVHSDLELLSTELLWRTGQDPLRCMERALRCADDSAASTAHRVQALVIGAIVAENLCEWDRLRDIRERVRTLAGDDSSLSIQAQTVELIFHTELGDLTVAKQAGEELVRLQRERGSLRGLAQALRFASYPLRVLGEYAEACRLVRESVELAEQHLLIGEAANSSDVLASISCEAGMLPAAATWHDRAVRWAERVGARYPRFGLHLLNAQLSLAGGPCCLAVEMLSEEPDTYSRDPIIRQRVYALAVLAASYRLAGNFAKLKLTLELIAPSLALSISSGRQDFFVTQYCLGLAATGEDADARLFAAKYLRSLRRDRSAPPSDLVALSDPGGAG